MTVEFTKESIHSHSGLLLFFSYLNKTVLEHFIFPTLSSGNDAYTYTDEQILRCYLAMLCLGHSNFEHIDLFRDSDFFKHMVDMETIPSKEIIRQRMDKMALLNHTLLENLSALNQFSLTNYARPSTVPGYDFIPVDFDVSVLDNTDSHKQGVEPTYKKGVTGYAPMFTYIGHEGFMLNQQFRAGSFHSNCEGSLEYIIQTMNLAKHLTSSPLLARLDSGNDAIINACHLNDMDNVYFIIKRNIRDHKYGSFIIDKVLKKPDYSIDYEDGTTVYYFSELVSVRYYENIKPVFHDLRQVFRVVKKTRDENNQPLLFPSCQLSGWWTNLEKNKFDEQTVIDLYKDHGTSEQFHAELKSELAVEKMPSGKFLTNELIMSLAQITYNLIKCIGQQALASNLFPLKTKVARLRIKTIINKIICLPAKFIIKFKKPCLKIAQWNPLSICFNWIYLNTNFIQ